MKKIIFSLVVMLLFAGAYFFFFKGDNEEAVNVKNEVVLYIANGGEPSTLDPQKVSGDWENVIITELFEGLVKSDEYGHTVPGIAKNWKISDDGLILTFYLREDAKWSDGKTIVAADFVYSFQRAVNPDTVATWVDNFYPIKNALEIYKGEIKDLSQLGVSAPDDYTFIIQLNKPTPFFIETLTQGTALVVPKHIIEKHGMSWTRANNMVTSGPYKLDVWENQNKIEIIKNNEYWDSQNVQIDRAVFYPIDDYEAAVRKFKADEVDMVSTIPSTQFENLKRDYPDEFYLNDRWLNYYYSINIKHKPLDDIRVRKALSMSIDREKLAKNVLKLGFTPNYGYPADGMVDHTRQEADFKSLTQSERNKVAKQLLAEAGFGPENPLRFELSYNTSENHELIAVAIQQMWKVALDADVSLANSEAKVHYANLVDHNFHVGRAAFGVGQGDAFRFLRHFDTMSEFNYGQYSQAEVDMNLRAAKHMVDMKKRRELLEKVGRIIMDDYAVIPLFTYQEPWLVSKKVKNYHPNPGGAYPIHRLKKKEE